MPKIAATLALCLFTTIAASFAHADTPLEGCMKKMGKAFKQLNLDMKQPVDASKPDYVALAATIKTESQNARSLVPARAAALPPDQQAAMVADYQKSMDDFGKQVDVLTQELQDGKWDDATKQLDVLKQAMFAGHKEFRVQKQKGGTPPPAPAAAAPAPAAETPAPAAPPAQ